MKKIFYSFLTVYQTKKATKLIKAHNKLPQIIALLNYAQWRKIGGKLMKKIDKNKLHQLIGKILLYISLYLLAIGMLVLGFIKNTIY